MHTELVTIETDTLPLDGALYQPDGGGTTGAVLLFHGNTMNFYVGAPRFLPPALTAPATLASDWFRPNGCWCRGPVASFWLSPFVRLLGSRAGGKRRNGGRGDGSQSNPRLNCMSDIETRWLEAGAISVGMTHRQERYV